MKKYLAILIIALAAASADGFAQDLVPKGKLVYMEYTDFLRSGDVFENYKARLLEGDRVEVSVYDYYQDFDSLTVYGDRQPLDSIQRVITRWIEWFHPKGKRANDERNKGRFMAVYDSGDTLLVERFTWCWGMKDIQEYLMNYSTYQKTLMPFEEIKGPISEDIRWHNGMAYLYYTPRKGVTARRYKGAGKEFLVFKNSKGAVTDIWMKSMEKKYGSEIEDGWMAIFSGVYENETGMSVFGKVNAAERRRWLPIHRHHLMGSQPHTGGEPAAWLTTGMGWGRSHDGTHYMGGEIHPRRLACEGVEDGYQRAHTSQLRQGLHPQEDTRAIPLLCRPVGDYHRTAADSGATLPAHRRPTP